MIRLAVVFAGCAMNGVAAISVLLQPAAALADSIPAERYEIAATRESQLLILSEFQTPKGYRLLRHHRPKRQRAGRGSWGFYNWRNFTGNV